MRLEAAVALFVALFAACLLGAPVPKQNPLTEEQVIGTWAYLWSSHENGIISFEADRSYSAQHIPGSDTVYAGTWVLSGNVVTITEYSFSFSTGERRGGPATYRFDFGKTQYPNLSGVSNGSTPVKIWNPKR